MIELPARTLFLMYCYAWRRFDGVNRVNVAARDASSLPNLLARVLLDGVRQLARSGLRRDYETSTETVRGVRGRLDVSATVSRLMLPKGQTICNVDELSENSLPNQIIRASIERLIGADAIEHELRERLCGALHSFNHVSLIELSKLTFGRVQLYGNVSIYSFLLKLCELVVDLLLPAGEPGKFKFVYPAEDRLGEVFQDFVRSFLDSEQDQYSVHGGTTLLWRATAAIPGHELYLPQMRTDIVLKPRSPGSVKIVETKLYSAPLQRSLHGRDKIHSDHLYQLFSYLQNFRPDENEPVAGLLLYGSVTESFDLGYSMQGHAVRVATLDLRNDWDRVKTDLLALAGC